VIDVGEVVAIVVFFSPEQGGVEATEAAFEEANIPLFSVNGAVTCWE
jgi:hypothetical protein